MKNLFKIVFVFALMAANLSWGGDFVEYLSIRVGSKETVLSTFEHTYVYHEGDYDYYTFVSNKSYYTDRGCAQDLLANTGLDYSYMGYTITPYVKNVNGSNYVLPITDVIVKDYSKDDYIPDQLYENGRWYTRVIVYKNDTQNTATDLCNGKCGDHRIQVYFTRDYIDGRFVRYVRAIQVGSDNSLDDGFEMIDVDLTGGKGGNGKKPIYLYIKKEYPQTHNHWFNPVPTGRDYPSHNENYMYFTGTPRALLMNPGTPQGSFQGQYIDHVEYKINDGPWTTSYRATDAGEYSIQAKIVTNSPRYPDYIYSDKYTMKAVIHKAPKLVVKNQLEDGVEKDYYLYSYSIKNQNGAASNFYSGDKITLTWSDKCGGTATRRFNNDLRSGKELKSGSYYLTVGFDETPNCEAISSADPTSQFASFTVKKSKITFNANGGTFSDGTSSKIVEGETGASYTKPANPTRTGWTFKGGSAALPSTIPRGETTITAVWTINQYTMTFNANGGTFSDGKTTKTITQNYNTTVAKPANPTRTDYVFTGWLQTSPTTTTANTTVPSYMPAQNMTFTAQWKYNRFKVDLFDQWEVVQGVAAEDGTYANGSTVKFRLKPGYVLWSNVTYDGQKVTPDENGVYTITVVDHDAKVWTTIAQVFGAIQVDVNGNQGVIIDGNSNETSEVPEEIEFTGGIKILRDFERYNATTVVLPFTIPLKYVWGGIFCKFLGMSKSGFNYTVRLMFVNTEIKANEPYVFVPLDNRIVVDFRDGHYIIVGGKFKLKTEEKSVTYGDWSFNSLYHKKEWNGGVSEGDANGQVSYYFKSSGQKVDGVSGSFVKMTDGSVGPMQAYISYNGNKPQAVNRSPSMAGKSAPSFSIADLPDEINIELVDESEKTVGLGKINMSTGKVKLDCWFDMKGNLLKGKPTAKGIYFYNGKQVIVK